MPVERSQGQPRPLVPRPDELPAGVQATEQAEAREERTERGTWTKGARTAQSKGGRALKNRTALSHQAGLDPILTLTAFRPYLAQAKPFAKAEASAIARTVGGGELGPGPASIVVSASLQLAASRYWFDQGAATGDPKAFETASRLADASRSNLLSAREMAAKEAKARPKGRPQWMTDLGVEPGKAGKP